MALYNNVYIVKNNGVFGKKNAFKYDIFEFAELVKMSIGE